MDKPTVVGIREKGRRYLDNLDQWGEIKPIPNDLLPVEVFHRDLLPPTLQVWAVDSAHRMDDMPLDFFAIGIVVSLGSLIGARIAIQPKRNDDWFVVPNLWGAGIGRPATKKTPALKESMRSLKALEAQAYENYQGDLEDYAAGTEADKIYRDGQIADLKKNKSASKSELKDAIKALDQSCEEQPTRRRFIVNDPTFEKLGELLKVNPMGLLLFRDELAGWLSSLDSEGREQDRSFYLEAWNGTGDFSADRIGRGEVYIPRVVVSVLGGIQPGKLLPYLRSMKGGTGDDGLLQRLQLLVWPDIDRPCHIDEAPDIAARQAVTRLFKSIDALPHPDEGEHHIVSFDNEAQNTFDSWYGQILLREVLETNPHIEAHLTKYHSLLPTLALIFQAVESEGAFDSVGIDAIDRAVAWCRYLETHARRVYALVDDPYYGAKQLRQKLPRLSSPFSKGDFSNLGWSGLTTATDITTAIDHLITHNFIKSEEVKTPTKPKTQYHINPALLKDDE